MVTGQSGDRAKNEARNRARDRAAEEAALWHARLQGDAVTHEERVAFEDWLRLSPLHQEAFASASDIWNLLPEAVSVTSASRPDSRRVLRRPLVQGLALAACLLLSVGIGWQFMASQSVVYETERGEQRVVALKDGTEVTLNTDSRLTVSYSGKARQTVLERGEAYFDVSSDPERPFTVQAGEDRVRVLGTSFVMRHEPQNFSVTLVEGRLEVTSPRQPSVVLAAGERAVHTGGQGLEVDRPQVETVTAWQKGEIIFSDTSLTEAVKEFNRYAREPIIVDQAEIGALRISGVFQTDKAAEFALTVAKLNGLKVRMSGGAIELTR